MRLKFMKRIVVFYPNILNLHFVHVYFNKLVAQYFEHCLKRQMRSL